MSPDGQTTLPFEMYRYLLRKYAVVTHVQVLLDRYLAQASDCLHALAQQGVNIAGFTDFLARFPRLCASDHASAVPQEVDGL